MTEVLFYQLDQRPLEAVLPLLLEKSLERGWRAVVQCGSDERLQALDGQLWTYRDNSFLPHGSTGDGDANLQPVYLTTGDDNPNAAMIRFLVDRAEPGDLAGYERVVFMFDGRDEDSLVAARDQWKEARAAGNNVTYWQQDDNGRWVQKG